MSQFKKKSGKKHQSSVNNPQWSWHAIASSFWNGCGSFEMTLQLIVFDLFATFKAKVKVQKVTSVSKLSWSNQLKCFFSDWFDLPDFAHLLWITLISDQFLLCVKKKKSSSFLAPKSAKHVAMLKTPQRRQLIYFLLVISWSFGSRANRYCYRIRKNLIIVNCLLNKRTLKKILG